MKSATVNMKGSLDEVAAATTEALRAEGFGVLVEIDLAATLRAKLGVERPGYRILGACNPPLADMALQTEPAVGLLLPCNVTLRDLGDGQVEVAFVDPVALLSLVDRPELADAAGQVASAFERVAAALADA